MKISSSARVRDTLVIAVMTAFFTIGVTGTVRAAVQDSAAEQGEVVKCLLPGQVRQLGAKLTYLAPRRPVETTAAECKIRGGELDFAALD